MNGEHSTNRAAPGSQGRPTWRHLARVVIETTAPIAIGTGRGEVGEATVVLDANGLPAIPGTTLAGVVRSRLAEVDAEAADQLFGYSRPVPLGASAQQAAEAGSRSLVTVSWAVIHDSEDRPVAPMLRPSDLAEDALLRSAAEPLIRDHVRLDHRGTAAGRLKFDQSSVMTGHRFTFEIEVEGDEDARTDLLRLLDVLADARTRLGGKTRAGLGSFVILSDRTAHRSFDLRDPAALDDYSSLPVSLATAPAGWTTRKSTETTLADAHTTWTSLELTAEEPWLIGGGEPLPDSSRKGADINPYFEHRVVWGEDGGAIAASPDYVLTASAVKGSLRHRTAFHLRARRQLWATSPEVQGQGRDRAAGADPWAPETVEGLDRLFGAIKRTEDGEDRGHPGRVFLQDVRIPATAAHRTRLDHVSLDRFTGAPMQGHLFSEDVLRIDHPVTLSVVVHDPEADPIPEEVREAFCQALDDLCSGRLQIGAGHGRGRGWFTGDGPTWQGPRAERWNGGAA